MSWSDYRRVLYQSISALVFSQPAPELARKGWSLYPYHRPVVGNAIAFLRETVVFL